MAGKARHYFPGNNTPGGFFSYYQDILAQREAEKIWCIKGGPGVGKSTFMKRIGEDLLALGQAVDFLHCSSDNNSLDGVVLRDLKIALIDGTSPHIVDPKNPGAVDEIINLGDFWNEEGIRRNRLALIATNEKIQTIFKRAYGYLNAASSLYETIADIAQKRIKEVELSRIAAQLIGEVLSHREFGKETGSVKRFFASAITPNGLENFIPSLYQGYETIYLINAPIGSGSERILERFAESAHDRGYDMEAFYCPMRPETNLEHLLVPELSLAILTSNPYHRIDPNDCPGRVIQIDIEALATQEVASFEDEVEKDCKVRMDELLKQAVMCLKAAKEEHDQLETYYVPNMDFEGIEALRQELLAQLRGR